MFAAWVFASRRWKASDETPDLLREVGRARGRRGRGLKAPPTVQRRTATHERGANLTALTPDDRDGLCEGVEEPAATLAGNQLIALPQPLLKGADQADAAAQADALLHFSDG
jgi:hypothetical protein